MLSPSSVLLHDSRPGGGASYLFEQPREVLVAHTRSEAEAALARIDAAGGEGLWAAGYFAYELGYIFEERLAHLLPARSPTPLLWFGLYENRRELDGAGAAAWLAGQAGDTAEIGAIAPGRSFADYRPGFDAVMDRIERGDVYQVNLTLPAGLEVKGDPVALYRDLVARQPVAYSALLACGDHCVLSLSPELFIANEDGVLTTRPMKGTMPRGHTPAEDEHRRLSLAADPKNRAENLMIVDLLRNDLARVARMGSVRVTDLFTVETYKSLHQLTSGITASLRPGLAFSDILAALFPCGSITGAPKIAAMEIIAANEVGQRGVYTGSIGYLAPSGDFRFSVAIRTLVLGSDGGGTIGVGGGIVADSQAGAEYDEALLKLKFLTPEAPLSLIETLLYEPGAGYALLERHEERLAASAAVLGIPLSDGAAFAALREAAADYAAPMRVRLLLAPNGDLSVTATLLPPPPGRPFRFILAQERTASGDIRLFHKTTDRAFLDAPRQAAAARFDVDEVVFRNERGELTEGSITSLFLERDGMLFTPALACGLLPGTLRAELLASGRAREAVLTPADLKTADNVFLGNSVRGLMPAQWIENPADPLN